MENAESPPQPLEANTAECDNCDASFVPRTVLRMDECEATCTPPIKTHTWRCLWRSTPEWSTLGRTALPREAAVTWSQANEGAGENRSHRTAHAAKRTLAGTLQQDIFSGS